jgi:hypothetical protein
MTDEPNPQNSENIEPSDELAMEELDQVVGGGKKNTRPPEKPVEYMQVTLEEVYVSST